MPLTVTLVLVLLMANYSVSAQRAFTMRGSAFNGRGDATIIGNRVVVGSQTNRDNHETNINNHDGDGDAATTLNSSSATLSLPSTASIVWAGLYWGGRSTHVNRNTIKFKYAGQNYQTLTATHLDNGNTISGIEDENHYQCFAEVTSYLQTYGNGTYWAGDVYTQTGNGSNDPYGTGYYGGWALVVVYSDPNEIIRNITVHDGYNVCWNNTLTVHISGFLTPESGTFTTKVGVICWEGDLYISNDRLRMNANTSANNIIGSNSPGNNFFNGTITGTPRSPHTNQNWGVDFDYLNSNISPPNNSTATDLFYNSSGDLLLTGVLVFSIEINPSLLPVQLTSYSLECRQGRPVLLWATSSEINNRLFEIWKGTDTGALKKADSIPGKGTFSGHSIYSWTDENYKGGIPVFYQLRQIDYDGHYRIYQPLVANCQVEDVSVWVYPVPFRYVLNIYLPVDDDSPVFRLYDESGRLVKEQFYHFPEPRSSFEMFAEVNVNQVYLLEIITSRGTRYYKKVKSDK
jgi:hypothetical protein